MNNAVQVRDELLSLNFNTRIDIIYLSTKDKNLYAVREGHFKSKEYASGAQKKIKSRTGYNAIVVDVNDYWYKIYGSGCYPGGYLGLQSRWDTEMGLVGSTPTRFRHLKRSPEWCGAS